MPPLAPVEEFAPRRQDFHQANPIARPTEESMRAERVINQEEGLIALMEKFLKIAEAQVQKNATRRAGPQHFTSNQDGMPAPQKASATILICYLSYQEKQASSNLYYDHLSKKLTMLFRYATYSSSESMSRLWSR
jgi:hypothetical protein